MAKQKEVIRVLQENLFRNDKIIAKCKKNLPLKSKKIQHFIYDAFYLTENKSGTRLKVKVELIASKN